MNLGVRRVGELAHHEEAPGVAVDDFLRLGYRALHALGTVREHQFGPECLQHTAAFQAHRVRHGQHQPVALGCGDERQPDAGVATGRLHQDRFRADEALPLQRLDHADADTILDACAGVEVLELEDDLARQPAADLVEADQRRLADGLQDAVVDSRHRVGFPPAGSRLASAFSG